MKCAYCKKGFSCGCQKAKAADGQTVHKTCMKSYKANNYTVNTRSSGNLTAQVKRAKKNLHR